MLATRNIRSVYVDWERHGLGWCIMGDGNVAKMFECEQDAFVTMVSAFTGDQWELPSLCPEWTVRDVVVHVAFHTHRGLKETFGSTEKYTALLAERAHADTIDGLVAWLGSPAPATARKSKINLCELVIHQQDVRRAVGSPRDYPDETMTMCLERCLSVSGNLLILARKRQLGRSLRLVATDMSWSKGKGQEVTGTGEALLLAIAGRPAAFADLSGPGLALLARHYESDPSK